MMQQVNTTVGAGRWCGVVWGGGVPTHQTPSINRYNNDNVHLNELSGHVYQYGSDIRRGLLETLMHVAIIRYTMTCARCTEF